MDEIFYYLYLEKDPYTFTEWASKWVYMFAIVEQSTIRMIRKDNISDLASQLKKLVSPKIKIIKGPHPKIREGVETKYLSEEEEKEFLNALSPLEVSLV